MNYLFAAITITGGLVAASSLIIAKKPQAREWFDKAAPYQGGLGIVMLALGIWWAIRALPMIGGLFAAAPFAGAVLVGAIAADILIGFLLGFGLLNKALLSKNEAAKEKGHRIQARLAMVQAPLGLAAVVLGVLILK